MSLNLSDIIQHAFPIGKYFRTKYNKNQIVLHHTVSGEGVSGDITHWIRSKFRMGTCTIVGRRGDINQVFSSKYWAYHLGVRGSVYKKLNIKYNRRDMNSIGIEIDSYGGLRKGRNGWETVYGTPINDSRVIEYPEGYRGFYAFERYTDKQIEAVKDLLVYWGKQYGIPLKYNEDMWDVCRKPLMGYPGIWSHTSFRSEKSDCHPQIELISMLKSLTD